MKAQAVFFDLDETLVTLDRPLIATKISAAWQQVAEAAGIPAETLLSAHDSVIPTVWRAADARIADLGERVDGLWLMLETYRQAMLTCGCDDEALARRAFDYYWDNRHGGIQPFDDVVDTLQRLHGRFRLAVITNGPAVTQLDKLEVLGLDKYFDVFVASGEVGCAKPSSAIFGHTLARLQLHQSGAWHVGDSLAADVTGANNAGLTSVWLNRNRAVRGEDHPEPHHEITSLRELRALLEA